MSIGSTFDSNESFLKLIGTNDDKVFFAFNQFVEFELTKSISFSYNLLRSFPFTNIIYSISVYTHPLLGILFS